MIITDGTTTICNYCAFAYGDLLLWDKDLSMCSACPPETPVWDYDLQKCVPACPDSATIDMLVNLDHEAACITCEAEFEKPWSFWDPNARECVRACPDDTPVLGESKICQTCAQANASAQLWNPDTQECVAKCPRSSKNSVCTTCWEADPSKPRWDSDSETCEACPDSASGSKTFWNPETEQCVDACPELAKDGICKRCYELLIYRPRWDEEE